MLVCYCSKSRFQSIYLAVERKECCTLSCVCFTSEIALGQIITHPLIFTQFYWLLYVMWCKSPDRYHAITLPASIFVLSLLPWKRNKSSIKEFSSVNEISTFHLYYFTRQKNKVVSENLAILTLKSWSQILFRKVQKRAKFSKLDLRGIGRGYFRKDLVQLIKPIKCTWFHQSCTFTSTLSVTFYEQFTHNMKIIVRVII